MQFELNETQLLLGSSARQFLQAECPMAEVRRLMGTETAHEPALWRKIAEQGWTGLPFPEEYGGMGLGGIEMAVAMEEMGHALLPGPYLATVLMAGTVIDAAASEGQKRRYLPRICGGEALATVALLESSATWDPAGVQLAATPCNGGCKLDGTKLFVPDVGVAEFVVCAARLRGELALVVVPAQSPAVHLKPMPAMDLTRKLYALEFRGAVVGAEQVLATGDRAGAALERMFDVATTGLVAEMVGGMQRVLEITVAYAKTRKQFGKPIGQFQAVQHMCADMLLLTESSRSAAYYAAYALTENLPEAPRAVSVAKAYASEAYREVGNRGIQVHGGMGFTWENDVHLYYRRAKASEILFGDTAYHRERLARMVIDGT